MRRPDGEPATRRRDCKLERMHSAGARSFGLLAAMATIVALAVAPGCSTGRTEGPASVDAPQVANAVAAPSNTGPSADAAAPIAPTDDAGKGDDAERDAGATADAGADAGAPADAGLPTDAGVPVPVAPFHIVGRIDTRDAAGPRFGWPAVEVRARFSGASLSVTLQDTGTSYYDVSVDGSTTTPLLVTGGAQSYAVATGLAQGEHDLVLTRRTETTTGVTQLLGFTGVLVPTPAPSGRRIELVGDSITCGFGVLGADQSCLFSPSTEDEPLAWGAVAARELGALHMVTAVSGLGVIVNYGGSTTNTMPEHYDRSLADDTSSSWDHHAFEPDAIVVDLGTNDFYAGDPGPAFQPAYTSFLATLRARHAQAHIVAATSPMLSGGDHTKLAAYVAGAVAARQAAGDANVSWIDIDVQSAADGYGCAWHPSVTTQQKMAGALVAHLKPTMGW